jgi:hypothetical protein
MLSHRRAPTLRLLSKGASMNGKLSIAEQWIIGAVLGLAAVAAAGPHVPEPAQYQHFVDSRTWLGVPNAGDVLSNLAFLVAGVCGFVALRRAGASLSRMQRATAALFFGGLVLTAACSTWYHLAPDAARLVVDRSGMALAFAGLLGFAAAEKVSDRAAGALVAAMLLASPWALSEAAHGDVLAWAVLQFGGMALLVGMAAMRSRAGTPVVSWLAVIGIYALAKGCEIADAAIFEASHHFVSGHTLKHVLAALAALPVIAALRWHNRPAATRDLRFGPRRSPQ